MAQALELTEWRNLVDVSVHPESPQVHLHFLTSDAEAQDSGRGLVELCCHGCGTSLLVYLDWRSKKSDPHLEVRDAFHAEHADCPDHGYEKACPPMRSRFAVVDFRR